MIPDSLRRAWPLGTSPRAGNQSVAGRGVPRPKTALSWKTRSDDRGLRGAEVGGLLGGGVGDGGRGGGERALDGGAGEDVDLVALGLLAERHLGGVPVVAADAGAAHPGDREIAGGAEPAHVRRAQRPEAVAGEGVRGLEVGGVADVAVGGAAAPDVVEADLVLAHVDER